MNLYVLKYIGSKRRMAGTLASMIPADCTTYVEAYCGSAALALNSRNFSRKVLNDYNPHMANFWRVASSAKLSPKLLEGIRATTYSKALFEEAKSRRESYGANREDIVKWAVDTYVLNWQSFNALGDNWRYLDPSAYRNHPKNDLELRIALTTLCKQNIEVYSKDAVELLKEIVNLYDDKTFIFLDPPYLEGLRSKGKLYQTDMPGACDHIKLLKAIQNVKAKIVLSGYWSGNDDGTDLYDYYLLPHGWHRHLLGEYSKSCESGTEEKSAGEEWVWCNYDLLKEAKGSVVLLKSYEDEKKSPRLLQWLAVQSTSQRGGGEL